MANQYIAIGGLWQRDTKRGPVLSCQVNPAIRAKLLDALNGPELLEVTIFVNDRRDKPNSPTHNLVLAVQEARTAQEPRAATGMPEQAETGERRAPAQRQAGTGGFGDDFIRNPAPKRELDADDTPF